MSKPQCDKFRCLGLIMTKMKGVSCRSAEIFLDMDVPFLLLLFSICGGL